jgi:hypothetical protein
MNDNLGVIEWDADNFYIDNANGLNLNKAYLILEFTKGEALITPPPPGGGGFPGFPG